LTYIWPININAFLSDIAVSVRN